MGRYFFKEFNMPKPRDNFSSERTGQKKKKEEKVIVQSNPNVAQIKKQAQTEMRKQSEAQKNASKAQYAQNIHKEVSTGTRTVTSPEIKLAQQKAQKAQSYEATNNQRNRVDRFDHIPTLGEDTQKSKDKELMQKYESMDNYNVFERMFNKDKRDAYKEKQALSKDYYDALARNDYVGADGKKHNWEQKKDEYIPKIADALSGVAYSRIKDEDLANALVREGAISEDEKEAFLNDWAENAKRSRNVEKSANSLMTNPIDSAIGVAEKGFDFITGRPISGRETVTQRMRNEVADTIDSGVGKFGYNVGMSIGDMYVASLLGGGGSKAASRIMALEKGNETMAEAAQRGLNPAQIMGEGTVSAVTTYLTEKVPFEKIFNAGNAVGKNVLTKYVMPIVSSMLSEGGQEMAEDVADTIADMVIARDDAQLGQNIYAIMQNEGISYEEASKKALKEWAVNTILDGLAGAISGGALSGANIAFNGSGNVNENTPTVQETAPIQNALTNVVPIQNTDTSVQNAIPTIEQNENVNVAEPESVRSALSAYDQLVNDSGIESNPNERKAIIDNIINQNGGNVSENDMAKIQESLNAYEELARATGREITDAERRAVVTEMLNKVSENEWLNQDEIQIQERDNLASELENRDIITDTRMRRLDLEDDIERLKNGYATEHDKNIVIPQLEAELAKTDIYEVAYKRMWVLDNIEAIQNDNSISADIKQMVLDKYNEDYERYNKIIEDYINKNAPIPSVETENTSTENVANAIPTMANTVAPNPTVTAPANNIPSVTTNAVNPTVNSTQNSSIPFYQGTNPNSTYSSTDVTTGDLAASDIKERGYSESVRKKVDIDSAVKAEFTDNPSLYRELHNADTLANAEQIFNSKSLDEALANAQAMIQSKNPVGVALSNMVSNELVKQGRFDDAVNLTRSLAQALTESGQFSQAATLNMLNNNPIAALTYMERSLEKMNAEGREKFGKNWNDFALTEDERNRFANIADGDSDAINEAYADVYSRIARDYPVKFVDKLLEYRRISLLCNLRTIIRNLVSNISMLPTRWTAGRATALIEWGYQHNNPNYKRSENGIQKISKNSKDIATSIWNEQRTQLFGDDSVKWNDANDVIRNAQVFKGTKFDAALDRAITKGANLGINLTNTTLGWLNNATNGAIDRMGKICGFDNIDSVSDALNMRFAGRTINPSAMETMRNFTYYLLGELGDTPFVKRNFVQKLSSYIEANGITNAEDIPTDAILLAVQEANKATFHDNSNVAQGLTKIRKGMNEMTHSRLGDLILTFAKTPGNIGARMVEYSPIGFTKAVKDAVKTNKTINKLEVSISDAQSDLQTAQNVREQRAAQTKIKNLEKQREDAYYDMTNALTLLGQGFTGSAGILLGALLSSLGFVIGGLPGNKKKQAYEKNVQGMQENSFRIGNTSFSYDFLIPSASPILFGNVLYESFNGNDSFVDAVKNAGLSTVDAWLDSTPLKNVSEMFGGYGTPAENIFSTILDIPSSFVGSQIGAITRIKDRTVRDAYDSTSTVNTIKNGIMAKIPWLSEKLPATRDVWGREVVRQDTVGKAAFAQLINPGTTTSYRPTEIDDEIIRLNEATGDDGVYPYAAERSYTINGENIKLNNEQHSEMQRVMGETSYEMAKDILESNWYNELSDEERVKTLKDIYDLARDVAKTEVLGADEPTYGLYKVYKEKGMTIATEYLTFANAMKPDSTISDFVDEIGQYDVTDSYRGYYIKAYKSSISKDAAEMEDKYGDAGIYYWYYGTGGYSKDGEKLYNIENGNLPEEVKQDLINIIDPKGTKKRIEVDVKTDYRFDNEYAELGGNKPMSDVQRIVSEKGQDVADEYLAFKNDIGSDGTVDDFVHSLGQYDVRDTYRGYYIKAFEPNISEEATEMEEKYGDAGVYYWYYGTGGYSNDGEKLYHIENSNLPDEVKQDLVNLIDPNGKVKRIKVDVNNDYRFDNEYAEFDNQRPSKDTINDKNSVIQSEAQAQNKSNEPEIPVLENNAGLSMAEQRKQQGNNRTVQDTIPSLDDPNLDQKQIVNSKGNVNKNTAYNYLSNQGYSDAQIGETLHNTGNHTEKEQTVYKNYGYEGVALYYDIQANGDADNNGSLKKSEIRTYLKRKGYSDEEIDAWLVNGMGYTKP